MDYDFRNRAGPPYWQNQNNIATTSTPSTHPIYGNSSMYPKVTQPTANPIAGVSRNPPVDYSLPLPPGYPNDIAELGIRVYLKPEYRLTPLPPLLPIPREIPRSNFQYDFEPEKRLLAELEKENPDWSKLSREFVSVKRADPTPSLPPLSPLLCEIPRSKFQYDFEPENRLLAEAEMENLNWSKLSLEYASPMRTEPTPSLGSSLDSIVSKYIASGLNRDAVPIAVANYGDNPEKVRQFVNGFNQLREMGFSLNNVAEALLMYNNDTEKALARLLTHSS